MADEIKILELPEWDASSPVTVENMKALNAGIMQAAPVGSFTWYFGTKAPEGWLICDGNADLNKYPALKTHLNSIGVQKIPDMMSGRLFVRSVKPNKGNIAQKESAAVGGHYHAFRHRHNSNFAVTPDSRYGNHFVSGKYMTENLSSGYVVASSYSYNRRYLKTGPAVDNAKYGGWETSYTDNNTYDEDNRPANIALLPIIKY